MAANTSTPPAVLKLNTRVTVAAGPGIIRFVGQTSFAAGKWVGVELDAANGKNDGSVGGKRYFTCSEGRGMFVKPVQIRLLNDEDERRDEVRLLLCVVLRELTLSLPVSYALQSTLSSTLPNPSRQHLPPRQRRLPPHHAPRPSSHHQHPPSFRPRHP